MLFPAYNDTPSSEKVRVQTLIPVEVHRDLFHILLPQHGAATSIISHLLADFYIRLRAALPPHPTTPEENLALTIKLLNLQS